MQQLKTKFKAAAKIKNHEIIRLPILYTANETTHATTHCIRLTSAAEALLFISRFTAAIAATHGV